MTDILVIGGGLLGRAVALASKNSYATALTYNTNPLKIDGCATYQMDMTKSVDLIRSLKPQYIVLTAAMTNVDGCEADRLAAWKANALGPKNVASAAKDIGSKLIYVSTDYVFDGERGMYREQACRGEVCSGNLLGFCGRQDLRSLWPKFRPAELRHMGRGRNEERKQD
jgi:dTDP-4-dehydrorhamnose reductase